ncbi:hypothetical protein Tco_0798641 [Tanacetum coccineum]
MADFAASVGRFNFNVSPNDILSRVNKVFQSFNFQGETGSLQFWECKTLEDSKDVGCRLALTDQFRVSTINDNRLQEYRMKCLVKNHFIGRKRNAENFIGVERKVENWFAGRAAQTGVADHRTRHVMLNQGHQDPDEALGMGQLVVPVYFKHRSARLQLIGIIELCTTQPKESYVGDFNQIQNLLMKVNLTSTYMGKTIKVSYNHWVKFPLPYPAKLADLHKQVTMRFKELKSKTFCIKYEDTNHNHRDICNSEDLEFCLDDSISNRTTDDVIRMFVEDVAGK